MTTRHSRHGIGSPPRCEPSIEAYLSTIAGALPAGRGAADALAELRAGLLDAADAYQSAGMTRTDAAAAAVQECGDPHTIAAAFGSERAAGTARRTTLLLAGTGPLAALLWLAAARAADLGVRHAPPWTWANAPAGGELLFPLLALALATAVTASGVTITLTGPIGLQVTQHPRLAPTCAAIAGAGVMLADLAALSLLTTYLSTSPHPGTALTLAAAGAGSLSRLALAGRSVRRVLAARAAVTGSPIA